MNNEAKNDADKLIEYSNKIEIIQEKQLQIIQFNNERIDKVIDFAGKLVTVGELINENKRLDNERINLQNQFSQILYKHQRNMTVIEKRFEERGLVFSKYFEVIDKGLETGNDNLVLMGLSAVNSLVITDPLQEIQNTLSILESNDTLELDF
ncbi:hypothetical protein [Flavobacterium sp. IMCC34518]|uniref:hypothetical protein n=1 Tax=Flavobacterium sp. IMCC34518 TaxID=3003623 RepID=UPI0022AC5555|nr:hypothetical protein [Flavobacterium sp. IMCC34518]